MSTALRSVGLLDVLSSTPAESSRRAPWFHARLRRLATKPGEKCGLARISHQVSTAAADPGMSTALRSVGFLDVLSSTPAESSRRAPCIHARLRRLATKPGEKCGLVGVRILCSPVGLDVLGRRSGLLARN